MADDRDMAQAKEAEADEQADLELADEDTELVKGGRKKKKGGATIHVRGANPIRGAAPTAE